MITTILLLISGYLLGSFPYMPLVSRAKGIDLTQEPDMHMAMWQKFGRLWGFSGVFVDVLKGAIIVTAGFFLELKLAIVASAGVAAVIGQMWPVFQKFNGGKGNTAGIGVGLALTIIYKAWTVAIIGFGFMLLGFLIRTVWRIATSDQSIKDRLQFGGPASNSMPLGMLSGFAALPLVSWLSGEPLEMTLAFLVIFLAIVVRRLTADIRKDLKTPGANTATILLNRFLLDRGFY